MRIPRFFSASQFNSLCLLLTYTLAVSLFAPFAIKRVEAIPADKTIRQPAGKKASTTPAVKAQIDEKKSRWRDGELLVRFREHAPVSKLNQLLRTNGAQWNGQLRGQSGIERLRLSAGSDPETVAATLRTSEWVDFAEPNYLITADQTPSQTTPQTTTQTTPDDPRYLEQVALRNTVSPQAWAATTGAKQTVIAVLDSGIDFTHPDLVNNEWDNTLEQANNLDNDSNGFNSDLHGWDFVANSSGIIDEQGHGTAVAGIIAAQGNNATGISGVMWKAGLMSLRVLDSTGTGDVAQAIEAIDYAANNGAQVINCSWGTDDASTALREAINRAAQREVVVVTSAGNQGRDIETTPRYPASFDLPNLISVASIDNADQLTSFSNWGMTHVSIAAPGKDILTTKMGGDYEAISGSSASTAFVTGVAGLVKTLRPWLNADRTREMILHGARQVPALSDKVASKGIVNATGALETLNTLPANEGLDESVGNNGGEHGNNGEGRSSQRERANRPGAGNNNGDNHRDGREFSVTPPARTQGAPGMGLPNLDELRRQPSVDPKAAPPIPSTRCSHHDPQCNEVKRKAAINAPTNLLAWYSGVPSDADPAQPLYLNLLALNSGPILPYFLKDYSTPIISDSSPSLTLSRGVKNESNSFQATTPPSILSSLIPGNALTLLLTALPQASTYKIAFTSNRDGSAQLYLMDTDGSNQIPLTSNSANDESPRWSPDNTRILFQSDRDNPSSGAAEIYVMNSDATAQTRLTNNIKDDSFPVWSPAGNKIAFQSARNDLYYQVYVMNSDGSNQINLSNGTTNDGLPSWSPDGTKIAFTSERDHPGTPSIYMMNADGSNQTRLTFSAAGIRDEQPAWSPDGMKLVFTSTRDSVVESWQETDEEGGIIQRTAVRTNKEVYLMNADGSNQIRLTNSLEDDDSPTWSSDGTKIVFRSERERECCDPVQQVWMMNADGTNQVDLSNSGFGDYSPNWQRIAGNLAPTVSLTSPIGGTTLTALANMTITANANDSDGTISRVDFYQGTTLIGTDTTAPYSIAWNNVTQGAYSITAKATDNSGAATTSGPASITVVDFSSARVDPVNRTGGGGVDLLSGNANWSLPILGLKGRAGLDLGLSLSYNSLVWTKDASTNSIKFDADQGTPGPGFRLGFPVIQPRYYNSQVGKNAYLLITPSGSHVELRETVTPNTYESADSSYLQLKENGDGSLTLKPTDGSQLTYILYNGQYQCTQIKDRNGNFISITYYPDGRINTVTDTLARVVTFNYDGFLNLISITQDWGGGVTHSWATFGWSNQTIQTGFSTQVGPQNGTSIPVLSQVGLDDGSHYNFDYNSYAQVAVVHHYAADNHQLSYTSFTHTLPAGGNDCPRVSEQKDYAENWNNNQEATTTYALAPDHSSGQVTMPDGNTSYKELFATTTDWQKGLTTGTEYWSGGVKKKWTTTTYTQDDIGLPYQKNPRVTETNIYDLELNHKRTTINYGSGSGTGSGQYAQYGLPYVVTEYAADGTTPLRYTYTDYNLDPAYVNQRIIGLVSTVHVSDSAWQSKTVYAYDAGGEQLQATSSAATQHDDANYGTGFTARGNVTSVSRYNVEGANITNESLTLTTRIGYDTDGSIIFTRDPLWQPGQSGHQANLNYTDSFSDNVSRDATFAYPTKVTPPTATGETAENFASSMQYNYYFGAVTRSQGPAPDGQTQGAIQTFEYDAAGRISKVNNVNNGAYRRWVYDPAGYVSTFDTIASGLPESRSITIYDGAGRFRGMGADNPNSGGGYRGQYTLYDVMGRASQTSNPTEMTSGWVPTGDDAVGWTWTTQAYDWKGRPTLTTLPSTDGGVTSPTKEITYGGCGCAGGEIATIRDEVGRQQRMTADVLGRAWKAEVLDGNGNVYSTSTNNYNARDQITSTVEQGASGASQTTTLTYDGYGRLKSQQAPSQTAATQYLYNPDDTVQTVTDGRGIVTTFGYNNRHQVTAISYSQQTGIANTSDVSFSYDAAGNRTSMTDGPGSVTYVYDQLSRLTLETRQFSQLPGKSFPLSYSYNLGGELTSITDPDGKVVNYDYDQTGRMTAITGSAFAVVTSYASNLKYRAWGAVKEATYGDSTTLSASYNSRLLPTNFAISGWISKHYEYNADGRLRFTQDQLIVNSKFDRSYTYDHVGRVTQASSGPKARGQADTDFRPYDLSYEYDAMNHLTSRSGRLWSGQAPSEAGSYSNDKNTSWQYDVDGRLTNSLETLYSYDAAGRGVSVTGQGGDLTQTQVFDGNGVRTMLTSQQVTPTENGTTTETKTQYFVTSSALHSVITELDQSGAKTRTFVYQGGQILAWQQKSGATETMAWEHRDVSNASVRSSVGAELDPLGMNAGLINPFSRPSTRPSLQEARTYPGFADMVLGSQCQVDFIDMPCGMAGGEATALCPNGCRSLNLKTNRVEYFHAYSDERSGYLPPDATYLGNGYAYSPSAAGSAPVEDELAGYIKLDHAPQKTACSKFVDRILDIFSPSGVLVVDQNARPLVDIGRSFLMEAYRLSSQSIGMGAKTKTLNVSGFKPELIGTRQLGNVYQHVLGHIGAILIGDNYVLGQGFVGFNGVNDVPTGITGNQLSARQFQQDFKDANDIAGHPDGEGANEINDDFAGINIGFILRNSDPADRGIRDEIRPGISKLLCDN
jgi:YD repeat-containing protein